MTGSGPVDTVDLLVIGGGITGAGIALEAARRGVSVRLVEARDFASGTSSRSSKLVHGGLRYLREGAIGLTRESVHERRRLLQDAPGLVEPQRFLIGHYHGRSPGRRTMAIGLALYDLLNGARTREHHDAADTRVRVPGIAAEGLQGASSYLDAKTDDARLVWRVLQEARHRGARIDNYLAVRELLREPGTGEVVGVRVERRDPEAELDREAALHDGAVPHRSVEVFDIRARCVINATGAWGDALRGSLGAAPTLRPLRGSHLLFPLWRLPVAVSVSLFHPRDGRPVFVTPWEGMALVGTTDLDHREGLDHEPAITPAEATYLMEAVHAAFPSLAPALTLADAVSAYAGVRPVIGDGDPAADPSKASREHAVFEEQGLITVTGGKLTTFRVIALDALRRAAPRLPALAAFLPAGTRADAAILDPVAPGPALRRLPAPLAQRLIGRHGLDAETLVALASPDELQPVAGTPVLLAELAWCARHERVRHLDDLLLRRTRLGLLLPEGGAAWLPAWAPMLQDALGWDAPRWAREVSRYRALVARCYAVPAAQSGEASAQAHNPVHARAA